MQEISTKPYLLRALYEWCTDNGYTPHIAVRVDNSTRVPVANGSLALGFFPRRPPVRGGLPDRQPTALILGPHNERQPAALFARLPCRLAWLAIRPDPVHAATRVDRRMPRHECRLERLSAWLSSDALAADALAPHPLTARSLAAAVHTGARAS